MAHSLSTHLSLRTLHFCQVSDKNFEKENPFQSTDSITRPAYFPQTSPPARDTGMEEYRYLLKIRNLWKP